MLILSRKVGERVFIGNEIIVVVKHIKSKRVTIAVEAPQSVPVLRTELRPERRQTTVRQKTR